MGKASEAVEPVAPVAPLPAALLPSPSSLAGPPPRPGVLFAQVSRLGPAANQGLQPPGIFCV